MKLIIGVSLIIGVCCGKHRLYVFNTDCVNIDCMFLTQINIDCVFLTQIVRFSSGTRIRKEIKHTIYVKIAL